MAEDSSLTIARENSPTRCTSITPKGQCNNESRPGTLACPMHSRIATAAQTKRSITELYEFKFQNEVRDFASAGVMSLKAEVSILRTCLQQLLITCDSGSKLILNMGPIQRISSDIGNLLSTMDRINMNSGNLLDADDIVQIAQEIIHAIGLEINDSTVLARLAESIKSIISSKFSPDQVA